MRRLQAINPPINGKRHDAVRVSANDRASLQETMYLLPGMQEPLREGLSSPVEHCDTDLDR